MSELKKQATALAARLRSDASRYENASLAACMIEMLLTECAEWETDARKYMDRLYGGIKRAD